MRRVSSSLAFVIVTVTVSMACGNTGTGGGADNALNDEFLPSAYPRDCVADADCIRVSPLSMCALCCTNDVAVRREPAERDYAEAIGDCAGVAVCRATCEETVPACQNGQCVLKATP